jgi:16S rRNA (guanine(966)-N(2))-methyltransferase RsmD
MLRIIAGRFRSRLIITPDSPETQPTKDRVKEAIFSSLGIGIIDKDGLDLFAGSGSLGFEALSRGSASMVFNDRLKAAVHALEANVKAFNVESQTTIFNLAYSRCLEKLAQEQRTFDFIFLDPPYAKGLAQAAYEDIAALGLFKENGILIVEDSVPITWLNVVDHTRLKHYEYGMTHVAILWK